MDNRTQQKHRERVLLGIIVAIAVVTMMVGTGCEDGIFSDPPCPDGLRADHDGNCLPSRATDAEPPTGRATPDVKDDEDGGD